MNVRTVIVIAPHPDDETLGCGGTLLKLIAQGVAVHWVIVTDMHPSAYSAEQISIRQRQIETVANQYGFAAVHRCGFAAAELDSISMSRIVQSLGAIFSEVRPTDVFVPNRGDAHSDHAAVFQAAMACCKWFRFPSIKRVMMYEVLSETDFAPAVPENAFMPTVFVDISEYLDKKIELLKLFASEVAPHPFPRSETAVRAQGALRGVQAGSEAAEAFVLLKEIW